jgi:hypothetical protein
MARRNRSLLCLFRSVSLISMPLYTSNWDTLRSDTLSALGYAVTLARYYASSCLSPSRSSCCTLRFSSSIISGSA